MHRRGDNIVFDHSSETILKLAAPCPQGQVYLPPSDILEKDDSYSADFEEPEQQANVSVDGAAGRMGPGNEDRVDLEVPREIFR